jgi:hypothetical protein
MAAELFAASGKSFEVPVHTCERVAEVGARDALRVEARPASHPMHVEAVEGHHHDPRVHEVADEFFLSVGGGLDLSDAAQLRVDPKSRSPGVAVHRTRQLRDRIPRRVLRSSMTCSTWWTCRAAATGRLLGVGRPKMALRIPVVAPPLRWPVLSPPRTRHCEAD